MPEARRSVSRRDGTVRLSQSGLAGTRHRRLGYFRLDALPVGLAVVEVRRLGFAAKSVGVVGRETETATVAIGFATEAPEVVLLRLLGLPNSPADSTMAISR